MFYDYFAVISQLVCLQDSILKDCFVLFCFQLAEKYFVKGGDPRAAIEMYTKANMYEAAHKVRFLKLNKREEGVMIRRI